MVALELLPQLSVPLLIANPLRVNDLGRGWRNVAPVLKAVKQYLCNGFAM
jgi:hypothetical protein